MRLADLERVLQREESLEQVDITRVEMCEGLMEEMAAEEQQAVQESRMVGKQCRKVGKQGIRWADMEESQIEIDKERNVWKKVRRIQETGLERWVSYDMAVEEHEAVMQREEEKMKEVEKDREQAQDLVQRKDWGIERREWDWENTTEVGSTREAFEPRGSKGLEGQQDRERKTGKGGRDESGRDEREKGGKERQRHEERGKEGGRDESGRDEKEKGGERETGARRQREAGRRRHRVARGRR